MNIEELNTDQLISTHLKLKNLVEETETKAQTAKKLIKSIGQKLSEKLNKESYSSDEGVAYELNQKFVTIDDWEGFLNYVIENSAYHLLGKKVAQRETLKMFTDEEVHIPGLKIYSEDIVVVRRKTAKAPELSDE